MKAQVWKRFEGKHFFHLQPNEKQDYESSFPHTTLLLLLLSLIRFCQTYYTNMIRGNRSTCLQYSHAILHLNFFLHHQFLLRTEKTREVGVGGRAKVLKWVSEGKKLVHKKQKITGGQETRLSGLFGLFFPKRQIFNFLDSF